MVIGKREGGPSWKIGEEIVEEVELSTWDYVLNGNYEVMTIKRRW